MATLVWTRADRSYLYLYGETGTPFSAQIGESTTGGFAWMIFHSESPGCVHGGRADTIEAAKQQAQEWIDTHAV